tara:strand:+ start:62 stop:937 length:876 start_codon:yes stop_codon:yes gene_type:complete
MKHLKEMRLADDKIINKKPDLRVLSLGAGVQSSTLLMKIYNGEIAPVDVAIFADTGNEPQEVYDWFEFLKDKVKDKIKIESVKNNRNTGNIAEDILSPVGFFASIPVYTTNKETGKAGITLRTCTDRYKIRPIGEKIRELLDVSNLRGRVVEIVMGISFDEIQRAKYPPNKWQINCYPLVENKITRHDCLHYFESLNFPTPPRSACVICPYHSNKEWKRIKDNFPEEFEYAVNFDNELRSEETKSQFVNKLDSELFLYKEKVPLKDATFEDNKKGFQGSLFDDECEGYCGV